MSGTHESPRSNDTNMPTSLPRKRRLLWFGCSIRTLTEIDGSPDVIARQFSPKSSLT